MVMVRAVLPSGNPIVDDYSNIIDYEPVVRNPERNRRFLRPLGIVSLVVLVSVLVLVAGTSRWTPQMRMTTREHHIEAPAVAVPPRASREGRSNTSWWIPRMAAGLVDAKQGKVPSWHQCWTPLCKPCEVQEASAGSLQGLHVFVLSHGGRTEQGMRETIRETWGRRAQSLGAKVEFVLGDSVQQWGKEAATSIHAETERYGDLRLLRIRDFQGNAVEDSYRHLAYKVASLAAAAAKEMQPGTWMMKVDTDTYLNTDRLALDIAEYREEHLSGAGAWQYAGYHNKGGVKVRAKAGKKKGKEAAWVEAEYGAKHTHYPPYAFGAAGWLLGYDALQAMVATAADPSVLRPKVNEDAMVGALLEGCGSCTRKHWAPCQILGGTSFPFASITNQGGCPTLFERIGMAVVDGELSSFRCLITVSELKRREHLQGVHSIISSGEL